MRSTPHCFISSLPERWAGHYVYVVVDILPALKGEVSRVKRIEDSRTSQISDLLSVGIITRRGERVALNQYEPQIERRTLRVPVGSTPNIIMVLENKPTDGDGT